MTPSEPNPSKPCTIAGCSAPSRRKSLCDTHYDRIRRNGHAELTGKRRAPGESVRETLMRRSVITPEGCWEWSGARNKDGYGLILANGRSTSVHRAAYEAFIGPLPSGHQLEVDHTCRNRPCCNPAHLEAVEPRMNSRRRLNTRPTHCREGHELTADNTLVTAGRHPDLPRRKCRTCHNAKARKRYAASKP